MNCSFSLKLAWTGIKKNKKLYKPYILTCSAMVMMFYIISALACSPLISNIRGGTMAQQALVFGTYVIGIFSVIFIFYTNSFLMRRRKKEFGLYNVLGMSKKNISVLLFFETLITAVISLVAGLVFGIAFSKFSELLLVKMINGMPEFSFYISTGSIVSAVVLFFVIFGLMYLNSLRQIHLSDPINLIKSEKQGEKPPKANFLLGIIGTALLLFAYYLAVTIKKPEEALVMFFIAVIMVILATYLLFIAGSVMLCRVLQKKKKYYYKPNHFVSVSSMMFRMKRGGAGLASICILLTMCLVMLSSTTCLYIGAEDSINLRYAHELSTRIILEDYKDASDEVINFYKDGLENALKKANTDDYSVTDYRVVNTSCYSSDGELIIDEKIITGFSKYEESEHIRFIPLSDYNRMTGKNNVLSDKEALIYTSNKEKNIKSIKIGDSVLSVCGTAEISKEDENLYMTSYDSAYFVIVLDINNICEDIENITYKIPESEETEHATATINYYCGFDINGDSETKLNAKDAASYFLARAAENREDLRSYSTRSKEEGRLDFYATYGGLLFLGIILGIVFVFAAVLIMYYKQISEGYEDKSRFEIMQKVGMTKKEIKKSINSQILIVFFMPLLAAGIHLIFAFPLLYKLLLLMDLTNKTLLMITTGATFVFFALLYFIMYHITSSAYYSIVSNMKE